MQKMLTGILDLDIEIILYLGDEDISNVRLINKYFKNICESDNLWYRKLINKINLVKKDNFSKKGDLKDREVNGKRIKEMQNYFGLKNLKELDNLFNKIPKNAIYLEYYDFERDENINDIYKLKIIKLPKCIDFTELMYELRRSHFLHKYKIVLPNRKIHFEEFFGMQLNRVVKEEYIEAYKILGIL